MSAESIEERLERIERMAQRALDYQQVANLMGKYVYMHEVGRDPEFPDTLYAQKTPGVSWEVANFGKWLDEGIRKPLSQHTNHPVGSLFEHTLATPVIEIAEDGKTAKGVWTSPGHETIPDPRTGEVHGFWCWSKYGCDFVKEDGEWKIWHYHSYATFLTPYHKDWVEGGESQDTDEHRQGREERFGKPDLPTTYHHPYTKNTLPELVPEPPEPYETWDGKSVA